MRRTKAMILFASAGLLASCSLPSDTSRLARENSLVAAARSKLVGLTDSDIRMCAGFPTATAHGSDGDEIWTYKRDFPRGNINLAAPIGLFGSIPVVSGSANVSSGGYCNAQFRLKDAKVTEVEFAGDNNTASEINGLCVSMIDGCVVYADRHGERDPRPK